MNIAIALAGGTGSRVGSALPKQFLKVADKPILVYTLEALEKNAQIDEIVLVCIEQYLELARRYVEKFGIRKVRMVTAGGEDFTHSCMNGMNTLRSRCGEEDIVVVVSADRPFISQEEIDDAIDVCRKYGSGLAARKCALCMFMVGDDRTHSRDYQRERLIQIATPWAFRFDMLLDALDRFEAGELPDCESYPPAIFAAAGNEVYFSRASPRNIKITEATDVLLMEQIVKERIGNESGTF